MRAMPAAIEVSLRPVVDDDLPAVWVHQQANRPEVATPAQREAFMARWRGLLNRPNAPIMTITASGQVVGYVALFQRKNLPEVSYELGRPHWGNGFATAALRQFLCDIPVRPIYARAAKGNAASMRVLEKCGFTVVCEDRFTDASGEEHEEFVFELR